MRKTLFQLCALFFICSCHGDNYTEPHFLGFYNIESLHISGYYEVFDSTGSVIDYEVDTLKEIRLVEVLENSTRDSIFIKYDSGNSVSFLKELDRDTMGYREDFSFNSSYTAFYEVYATFLGDSLNYYSLSYSLGSFGPPSFVRMEGYGVKTP